MNHKYVFKTKKFRKKSVFLLTNFFSLKPNIINSHTKFGRQKKTLLICQSNQKINDLFSSSICLDLQKDSRNNVLKIESLSGINLHQRFYKQNLSKSHQKTIPLKDFFPHKKSFMQYWVLPFTGLATYFSLTNSQFSPNFSYLQNWLWSPTLALQYNYDCFSFFPYKKSKHSTLLLLNKNQNKDSVFLNCFKDKNLDYFLSKSKQLQKNDLEKISQFYFFKKKYEIQNILYSRSILKKTVEKDSLLDNTMISAAFLPSKNKNQTLEKNSQTLNNQQFFNLSFYQDSNLDMKWYSLKFKPDVVNFEQFPKKLLPIFSSNYHQSKMNSPILYYDKTCSILDNTIKDFILKNWLSLTLEFPLFDGLFHSVHSSSTFDLALANSRFGSTKKIATSKSSGNNIYHTEKTQNQSNFLKIMNLALKNPVQYLKTGKSIPTEFLPEISKSNFEFNTFAQLPSNEKKKLLKTANQFYTNANKSNMKIQKLSESRINNPSEFSSKLTWSISQKLATDLKKLFLIKHLHKRLESSTTIKTSISENLLFKSSYSQLGTKIPGIFFQFSPIQIDILPNEKAQNINSLILNKEFKTKTDVKSVLLNFSGLKKQKISNFELAQINDKQQSTGLKKILKLQQPILMWFKKENFISHSYLKTYPVNNFESWNNLLKQKLKTETNLFISKEKFLSLNSYSPNTFAYFEQSKRPESLSKSFSFQSYKQQSLGFHNNTESQIKKTNLNVNSFFSSVNQTAINLQSFLEKYLIKMLILFKQNQIYLLEKHSLLNQPLYFNLKLRKKQNVRQTWMLKFKEKPSSYLWPNFLEQSSLITNYPLNHVGKKNYKELFSKNIYTRTEEKIFRMYLSNKSTNTNINNLKPFTFFKKNKKLSFYKLKTLKQFKTSFKQNSLVIDSPVFLDLTLKNLPYLKEKTTTIKSKRKNQISKAGRLQQNLSFSKYPPRSYRHSPQNLLRKLGFLFVYQNQKLDNQGFPLTISKETFNRLEKHKAQQKKRRRKKRKRFYPRPVFLRFLLYKNFLTNRYSSLKKWFMFKNQQSKTLLNQNKFLKKKTDILHSNKLRQNRNSLLSLEKSRKIFKNMSFSSTSNRISKLTDKANLAKNSKYNISIISNNIKKETNFHKKWKSHKFSVKVYRNNKQQWGLRFQDQLIFEKSFLQKKPSILSFPIFNNQKYYQISNSVMSDFQRLAWKSYWLRSSLTPYIRRIEISLKKMSENRELTSEQKINSNSLVISKLKNDSIINLQKKEVPLGYYLNIKDSFTKNSEFSSFSSFNQSQNNAEYNRILYERLSETIQNVKSNLNANGQTNATSFKRGRRRKEKISRTDFLSKVSRLFNNSFNLSQIQAFSLGSFQDWSIKSFGELPTLRALWVLNKTNIVGVQNSQKNNLPGLFGPSVEETKGLWSTLKFREQNSSNKTKKFFYNSWDKFFPKNLQQLSLQKVKLVDKKQIYAGVNIKSHQLILRELKLKLKNIKKTHQKSHQTAPIVFQAQKSPTRSTHFWWSINLLNFDSFLTLNRLLPHLEMSLEANGHTMMNGSFEISFLSYAWSCILIFHICCLFSLLQIPEIRSFSKFYLLLLYKFSSSYLIIVYSIFNLLKNYLKHIIQLLKLIRNQKTDLAKNSLKLLSFKNANFLSVIDFTEFNVSLSSPLKSKPFFAQRKLKRLMPSERFKRNSFSLPSFTNSHFKTLTNQKLLNKNIRIIPIKVQFKNNNKIHQNKEFSVLEMCFSLPNIKKINLVDELSNKIQTASSNNLTQASQIERMNKKQKTQIEFSGKSRNPNIVTFFQKHFLFSSVKNTKTLIYSFIYFGLKYPIQISNDIHSGFFKKKIVTKFDFYKGSTLSLFIEKVQSFIGWFYLLVMKSSMSFIYDCNKTFYFILFKIIDSLESLMFVVYKFLEKPAELMIEWIAQFFLVEWSSDIPSFVPDSFDIFNWYSFAKLSRGSRGLLVFFFLVERRIWCLFEIFLKLFIKPDSDLLARQKKGTIFWDIWAEVLLIAAEKYRINLSSLTTLKEEQETFLERLLDDPNWLSFSSTNSNIKIQEKTDKYDKQTSALAELELLLTIGERPKSWQGKNLFFSANNQNKYVSFLKGFETYKKIKTNNDTSLNKLNDQTLKLVSAAIKNQNFQNYKFKKPTGFTNMKINMLEKRWSANQYFTSQGSGRETDLFIDMNLPKSFQHLSVLNSSESGISGSGFQTLGLLTCQIYSGLFSKQISKNILVVGSAGTAKSLIIHALAGETELKMITDNAYRYAHIQRGVAVGMKFLRDVFDGLALHAPCLFLMEDIHVIGERRPMLISDNENAKAAEPRFTSENEEIHEKNQLIYQLSKHAICDYKKPYKGDFSLLIPTNHFCFDLFLGVSPPRIRKFNISTRSPLPLETKFFETQKQHHQMNNQQPSNSVLISQFQVSSEQFFAPPATSPFTIVGMKEQRKFKANKLVKEIPWGGFSNDQMILVSKVMYSIRVKIALLADLAMNQLTVKLDMITDLLVIMDNVRSNRGFVVFATTHVPFILDPALRRPGRLDETISLPLMPNLLNRFNILKTNLSNYSSTFDFLDYSLLFQNFNETDFSTLISQTKLLLFNNNLKGKSFSNKTKLVLKNNSIYSVQQSIKFITQIEVVEPEAIYNKHKKLYKRIFENADLLNPCLSKNKSSNNGTLKIQTKTSSSNFSLQHFLKPEQTSNLLVKTASNLLPLAYSQVGKFMIESRLLSNNRSFHLMLSSHSSYESFVIESEETIFNNLYSPSADLPNLLMFLLAGKVGESFGSGFNHSNFWLHANKKQIKNNSFNNLENGTIQQNFTEKTTQSLKTSLKDASMYRSLSVISFGAKNSKMSSSIGSNSFTQAKVGIDQFWSSATSFVFGFIQKRYLYQKNLLSTKLFSLMDLSGLKEPPTAPTSSILMPAKKYENLKRIERDFQEKSGFSILEKIQIHQQQRFMKKLYEQPVVDLFKSEMVENQYTHFNTSIKELAYYNSCMRKPSSIQSYYKNRILARQKFSLVNQWCNSQLPEHNLETTFYSDVDWRSMFVESFGDLVIDFPDMDQHYNPKLRRWFLQSTYGGYWQTFEKTLPYEIYQHFINLCFNQAFNYLNTERELFDYLSSIYLKKGSLKEIDLISSLSRFFI